MTSKRKTKQLRWLVTMFLLVTAMAMPKMAWAEITPKQPSGDGTSGSPYQIGTAAELYWFAALVKGDTSAPEVSSANTGACATLTADITVNTDLLASLNEDGTVKVGNTVETWTPIGNYQKQYTGIFDGQGHTISGLYFNDSNTDYVGLFGFNKGTIKNVGVVDSYFYGHYYVGSVCGYQGVYPSNNISISNCYSTGKVSGKNKVGGVCGRNYYSTITGCYNTGTVSSSGDESYVGGVCGQDGGGTITGCYNTGTVSGSGKYVGGVCGDKSYGTITGCYNTGTVSGSYVGGVCGYNNGSTMTGCYNIGKVSGSYVGGVCGYNSVSSKITGCYTNTGGVCDNNKGTITDDCGEKSDNEFTNGTVCSLLNDALQNANASVRFYQGVSYPELMNFPALVEGVYQISNKGELYAFALLVNNGETSANAVLTKDITVNTGVLKEDGTLADNYSDFTTWTPIGNDSYNPYTGIFDGQGHTISGLYFNNSNTSNVGLFEYNKGTIKNVGVVDSYFYGYNNVGGVCGYNTGAITGCYNTGTVRGYQNVGGVCGRNSKGGTIGGTITGCYNTGTVRGYQYVGGVCGDNANPSTITGCYNTGSVSGSGNYVGGVCGSNYSTITGCYNTGMVSGSGKYVGGVCGDNINGTITGCYNTGSVSGSGSKVGGVCGDNSGTITNCYYLSGTATGGIGINDVAGSAEAKTTTQFASGEVCYLLSQGTEGSVWGQQLGIDDYPVASEYKLISTALKKENNTYWATFSNLTSDVTLSVPVNRTLTVYNATVKGSTMTLTERNNNCQVAKGEGVLLKSDDVYVNAKANETNELTPVTYTYNNLVATPATEKTIDAGTGFTLYRLTYNKLDTKEGLGFYLGVVKDAEGNVTSNNGSQLKATPGKAYLKVAKSALGTAPIRGFVIGEDDNTTGIDVITINGIDINDSKVDDSVYDLMGRKVSKPAKGIYIKNGKKVIIK